MRLVGLILGLWSAVLTAEVVVPAFTAYSAPDAGRGARFERDETVRDWNPGTELLWFGRFARAGELRPRLVTAGERRGEVTLTVSPQQGGKAVIRRKGRMTEDGFGFDAVDLPRAGYYKFTLGGGSEKLPDLKEWRFGGPAADGAHFSTVERHNAASVHLGYPVPDEVKDDVEWFYMEVTPKTDPLWTYYMATGWHRGYFGMQVNSPTERRIIFSVWDSGGEAVDRNKVEDHNRVKLLAKGGKVNAGGFGNEGTGGHSHLVYPWKLGDTIEFLMQAKVEGDRTAYTGWFRRQGETRWNLVASFLAPKDGKHLHGLYSFSENFGGRNGHEFRMCEFGNGWIRSSSGTWLPLTKARFTHDGHGKEQRLDRSGGVHGKRFYLAQGGFVEDTTPGAVTKAYDPLEIPGPAGGHPTDRELENLPRR